MNFPYLEITGSHKDVGKAIGLKFKNNIREHIVKRRGTIPNYKKLLSKTQTYYNYTINIFPNLIEELQSIAKAAEIPPLEYFFMNTREVYDEDYNIKNQNNINHCTTVVSFNNGNTIIGHNEDWSPEAVNDIYVLKATIGDLTFLGLQYTYEIPGTSATINNFGLIQCINDLTEKTQIGVPKNFLSRAVLECKSLEDAQNLIKNTKCASGFGHTIIQNKEVCNVEVAKNLTCSEKSFGKTYVHTNHYIHPSLKHLNPISYNNSESRYQRAKELVKNNMTMDDMKKLLRDRKDKKHPILSKETIASIVIFPYKKEVLICPRKTHRETYLKYTL